jgi:RNA polymerase sigma-70 factor (ECF subfamily)
MVYRIACARLGNKFDADDILQEVFLRYIKCKTEFNDEEHIKAFLIRAAVNCSKSFAMSVWNQRTEGLDDNLGIKYDHPDESVLETVLSLPKNYRVVIHLFYYERMSIKDIARTISINESTVGSLLHRARKKLANMLKEEF